MGEGLQQGFGESLEIVARELDKEAKASLEAAWKAKRKGVSVDLLDIVQLADNLRNNVHLVLSDILKNIDFHKHAEKAWTMQKSSRKAADAAHKKSVSRDADDDWKSNPKPQRSSRNAALAKRSLGSD